MQVLPTANHYLTLCFYSIFAYYHKSYELIVLISTWYEQSYPLCSFTAACHKRSLDFSPLEAIHYLVSTIHCPALAAISHHAPSLTLLLHPAGAKQDGTIIFIIIFASTSRVSIHRIFRPEHSNASNCWTEMSHLSMLPALMLFGSRLSRQRNPWPRLPAMASAFFHFLFPSIER